MMKNKIDCSKKILIVSYIIAISLTLVMVIGTLLDIEVSPIENITLASWGEVTAANSFYFYYIKSKIENKLKIISTLPQDLKAQIDINQVINQ